MVKFYESVSQFKFSWEQVAQAFWKRYPNPNSNHVLTEDVFYREVKRNKLYSKRLLTKTNHLPEWGKRFVSSQMVCIIEESIVDPINYTLTTYTRNLGYTRVMSVIEKCTYTKADNEKDVTVLNRQAWISSRFFGFGRAIQAFGHERFRKNSLKASQGFQFVLEALFRREANLHYEQEKPVVDRKAILLQTAKKASDLASTQASPLAVA